MEFSDESGGTVVIFGNDPALVHEMAKKVMNGSVGVGAPSKYPKKSNNTGDTPKERKCPKCKANCDKLEVIGWICTKCDWQEDVGSEEVKMREVGRSV